MAIAEIEGTIDIIITCGVGRTRKKDLRKVQGKYICSTTRFKFTLYIQHKKNSISFNNFKEKLELCVVVNCQKVLC